MRFYLILFLLLRLLFAGGSNQWHSHSAHLITKQRWEIGLFQPLRYGLSSDLEYSTYPLWFFVMPNVSFKKAHEDRGSTKRASRISIVYPTPLLNMLSNEGIGGLIDPNITMPPMLGVSGSFLISWDAFGVMVTSKTGIDLGLTMGELDTRSNIDLPLVYHRLEVFHNKWGVHAGLDLTKDITRHIQLLVDFDVRLLPGLEKRKEDQSYQMHSGNHSIEHKLLLIWNRSSRFRIITGYKLVRGDFPYGYETRLLPYVPMLEKWVPILELQWAR